MRPFRRSSVLVAAFVILMIQACAAFQKVGAVPLGPSQQVRIETSGAPLVLQWRPTAGKPPIAESQAAAVKGILSSVSGDTMRGMVVLEPGGQEDLRVRRFHGGLSLFVIAVAAWTGIEFEQAWR